MKFRFPLLFALSVSLCSQSVAPARPLTNADVQNLVSAGVGSDVILAKIKTSTTAFDTSAPAIEALKKNGVSDALIVAMITPSVKAAAAPSAPAAVRKAVPLDEATVYIDDMHGFDIYIAAAFKNKKVPMTVVTNKADADYILEGTAGSQKAGWARILIKGETGSAETASVRLVDRADHTVVWAYSVNKGNSFHGEQSTAEACAKHLKNEIEKRIKLREGKN